MPKKSKTKWIAIGVRFLSSPQKIYTYKVRKPVVLGQTLVVQNQYGISIVAVVDTNAKVPDGWSMDTIKEIRDKVVPL